jgi:FlaA1/EpsC-like NDP-sugar epimerase
MPSIGAVVRGESAFALSPVPITDVLGRSAVTLDAEASRAFLAGKRILVTGAAGSIGSEVTRQVVRSGPAVVFGLDVNESDLFDLQQELHAAPERAAFEPIVGSVTNRAKMDELLRTIRPDVIFHAAAYKHVPLMETYPTEAVLVNTLGTYQLAKSAFAAGVERFVLVSTDKAVRPSSIMGASKRLAELALRVVAEETGLSACAVRFGNVLGSRGSVIPLFEKQISAGGPVTITDRRMKRYFMTIPEAAALIIQAGAFGDRNVIYMLDMGEEIAIKDLATRLIALHGLRPGLDIEIKEVGMRPGEKLSEELSLDFEQATLTSHSKIRILRDPDGFARVSATLPHRLRELREIVLGPHPEMVSDRIFEIVAEFDGEAGLTESVRQKLASKPQPIRPRRDVVNALTGSD